MICLLTAWTAISLARRSVGQPERQATVWGAAASVAAGCGIWASHSVIMIPVIFAMPVSFDLRLTLLSVAVSIAGAGLAFVVAMRSPTRGRRWWATGAMGVGIGAMHCVAAAGVRIPATVTYDVGLAVGSVVVGGVLAGAAISVASRPGVPMRIFWATLLLTFGICAEHVISMAAVVLETTPSVGPASPILPPEWLAAAVTAAVFIVMTAALVGLVVDTQFSRRDLLERTRLQMLADATFEGLLIETGGIVRDVNASLLKLLACRSDDIVGWPLDHLLSANAREQAGALLTVGSSEALETEFVRVDGRAVPVETLGRTIEYDGGPARVLAVRDISERRSSEERIHRLAYHDALTDLPNRLLFREHLQLALARAARNGALAILYLDLDRFKMVNDTLGHPIGDRLLTMVAGRLKHCVRGADIVARLGGDEFAIVQETVAQPALVTALCHRLVDALSEPFEIEGHRITIGVSVGVVMSSDCEQDADTLLKWADMALYRAKADGRGTWRFYEAEMNARMQARHKLEVDLRQALALDQFEVVYQPLIDVRSGAVTAFEALLRWHHPERGTVSPAEFIPLAEEIGLIESIGAWVLRRACAEAACWPGEPGVAVNLSPAQFRSRELVRAVSDALEASGLPGGRLELEVTESLLLGDEPTIMRLLFALRALGVRIAMDDFGTGYSSLSYLRRFPFDKIKIDQSFIQEINESGDACAIVRAVAGLGRSLGMTVNAEGVETEAQMAALRAEDCDEVQGFLFSRPIANRDVPQLLARFDATAPELCAAD